ncbi:MAG: CCA tRNA nucleotidyltransferase [Thermoflexales bacterium]|nr:CCA tRNA nucleotidyltransferase [Thermoflexales bacterium]
MQLSERLSPTQRAALDTIRQAAASLGMSAYLVGGAVRDWLLGAPVIDDLDFVVEGDAIALAQQLRAQHGGSVQLYPRFGTATWRFADLVVDIATARRETYPHPAALPIVEPSTLETDLQRRDFTVNAMALRLSDGALIDPLGGRRDLDARVLRALHPRSFQDDPTRILRGARYAARLGFAVEPFTRAWMEDGLPYLRALSGERMKYDMELIFEEHHPEGALALLILWGAFRALGIPVPSPETLNRRFDRVRETLNDPRWAPATLGVSRPELQHALGWGALTYQLGQLAVSRWVDWIPFMHLVRDALVALGALGSLSAALFRARPSQQSALLSHFSALALCLGYTFERDPAKRAALLREHTEWRRTRPVCSGETLRALGLPPGPRYGKLLQRLRDAWLDGEVRSAEEEEALLRRLLAEQSE